MRKLVALSVVAFLALSVAALAGTDRTIVGTVRHLDATAKTMTVRDGGGFDTTVYWNDATKLESGLPQEGETVTVVLDGKDSSSKPVAKSIAIQQAKKPY